MATQMIGTISEIFSHQGNIYINLKSIDNKLSLFRVTNIIRSYIKEMPSDILIKKKVQAVIDESKRNKYYIKKLKIIINDQHIDVKDYINFLEEKDIAKYSKVKKVNKEKLEKVFVDGSKRIKYSNHALRRANQRRIKLNPDQVMKLDNIVRQAELDGIRKAIFFIEKKFIFAIDCKKKIVITVMRYEKSLSVGSTQRLYFVN